MSLLFNSNIVHGYTSTVLLKYTFVSIPRDYKHHYQGYFCLCGVVREHSVKTPNTDYCYFHMEILYVDIYKFGTYSMNIL